MIDLPIPGMRLVSEANARDHWAKRSGRVRRQRDLVTLVLRGTIARTMMAVAPLSVTITRVAPTRGLDDDNAVSSAKAVRDAIAGVLGIDDRDQRVDWLVTQERGPWAVRIRIEPRA